MKKKLADFFYFYRAWQIPSNTFLGCAKYSGNPCPSYKILCVTPESLLKTKYLKKSVLSSVKNLWACFFVLSRLKDNREHFVRVQKGYWQKLCKLEDHLFKVWEVDRKIDRKRACFSVKETTLLSFSLFYRLEQTPRNNVQFDN